MDCGRDPRRPDADGHAWTFGGLEQQAGDERAGAEAQHVEKIGHGSPHVFNPS
jgi:hypothetical protein